MTTATVNGKTVRLTMEEKAKLLTVSEMAGKVDTLFVSSGNRTNYGYEVQHNGQFATSCKCESRGDCAHKIAANWYLNPMRSCVFCGTLSKSDICWKCL